MILVFVLYPFETNHSDQSRLATPHGGDCKEIPSTFPKLPFRTYTPQNEHGGVAPGRRPSHKTNLPTPVFQVLCWFQGGYRNLPGIHVGALKVGGVAAGKKVDLAEETPSHLESQFMSLICLSWFFMIYHGEPPWYHHEISNFV